jgi:hypothetical protein
MLAVVRGGVALLWTVMARAANSTSDQRSALLSRFYAICVEHSFGWMVRWHRLLRDCEQYIDASEAMVQWP